jgi:transposase InsO family protein
MRKERKPFTPEEKVAILKRRLVDKVPVSELCEEMGLRPTVFYRWQKELFENGDTATRHLGQWPAVHCPRLQGVHSHLGHDPVRTSPNYPQSNGKLERWHKSLKSECIRPATPLSMDDAKRLIQQYVDRYDNVSLHSAIGYVRPSDMLAGRQAEIHAERDRKLEAARQQRHGRRQQAAWLAGRDVG